MTRHTMCTLATGVQTCALPFSTVAQLAHRVRFHSPLLGFRPPRTPPTVPVTPVTRPVTTLPSPSGVPPAAPPVPPLVTCDQAPVAVVTTLLTSVTGVPAAPPARPPVRPPVSPPDRKSVVTGKCWVVRVDIGGRRIITKKKRPMTQ